MMIRRSLIGLLAALALAVPALAQEKSITVASTTSTQDPACSAIYCRCSRRAPAST